jgi:hypothetical protein
MSRSSATPRTYPYAIYHLLLLHPEQDQRPDEAHYDAFSSLTVECCEPKPVCLLYYLYARYVTSASVYANLHRAYHVSKC